MVDLSEFEDICPYTDEEAANALHKVASHPYIAAGSKFIFPDESPDFLSKLLLQVNSINDFQIMVMSKLVERVIATTVKNFSYDGVSNLVESKGKFLAMSNHRDIILDPAISNLVMFRNGIMMSEIAVGSNLITNDFIEALIRSNRMVKVVRGITARELYLSSRKLSEYIRLTITSGNSSIWLAQRQGRTKDGLDLTEQGLLKMLDMSGTKSFNENFAELNIIPFSISYEFEPCDILKAREMMISRREKYVKQPGEDWASIMYGINQWKGNVHLNIGKPLSEQELAVAAMCDKNDRYQNIRHFVDLRVIDGYRLWNNNFIAYDLRNHTYKYSDRYTAEDKEAFVTYMEKQLDTVEKELNRDELRSIFLDIYANPIVSKQMLSMTF